jgi:hypothetical protein
MKTALPGGRYSWAGICCSISFQALILRRRHTQHKGSSPALEVSAPHTEHGAAFLSSRSGETDRFACSNRSAGTTASGLICGLRFISMYSARFHYRRTASISQVAEGKFHTYAASGICTTAATSREDPHRGHFCPAATRAYLPRRSISAGTVWVQMGQCASPCR